MYQDYSWKMHTTFQFVLILTYFSAFGEAE